MADYRHIQVKYKPLKITSLNVEKDLPLNDLEQFFLACQDLICDKVKSGKKGLKFSNGQKITYKKLQGMLYTLESFFAIKGYSSFGICGTCEKFGNACTNSGIIGYCKGKERHAFESCDEHSKSGGGFGLE